MSCSSINTVCNDDAHRTYYPECYSSSTTDTSTVTDWAPYIQCALNDAAASGGTVLLGAMGVSLYSYGTTIEVGASSGLSTATLKGQSASVTLSALGPFGHPPGQANSVNVNPGSVLDTLRLLGNSVYDSLGTRITGVAFGGGSGASNAQIKNATIENFTEYGVNFAAPRENCTVSGCEISNNSNSGILSGATTNTGNFVLSNTIHDNGADGIDNGNGSNATISGNSCYGNGFGAFGGDDHGILLFASGSNSCSNNKVLSNTCYDNHGSGIKAYPNPDNPGTLNQNAFDSNECYGNGADGITVENCPNTQVTRNYLHGNTHDGLYGPGFALNNTASDNTWCNNAVSDVDAPFWNLVSNHTC